MWLYLYAAILSGVVLFAGMPSSLNEANLTHLRNGREPNAGIAFVPALFGYLFIWILGAWLAETLFGNYSWRFITIVSMALVALSLRRNMVAGKKLRIWKAENQSEERTVDVAETEPAELDVPPKSDRAGG